MTVIEQIEKQVQQLSPSELAQFRAWFHEFEWQVWEQQLEQDVKAGKLNKLAEKARADHANGRTTRI